MLAGNKNTFAVEYELDADQGGAWMYGKICYWIGSKKIGDYELGTSLRDVLFQLQNIVYDSGNRGGADLCHLLPNELFHLLNGLIYEDQSVEPPIPIDMPARFEIKIPVDVFDEWKIFLVDCENFSFVLFKSINDSNVNFARIKNGEFDRAITTVLHDLEQAYDIALSQSSTQ